MLDEKALILIAHSNWRTLMALYTLLDDEGYFVAPCSSEDELLKYCEQYKPELVMTSNPISNDEGGRLLETIKDRSPETRIVLLPEMLSGESGSELLDPGRGRELVRIAEAVPAPSPPIYLNGF
jgi:PleD family two-component response regulator